METRIATVPAALMMLAVSSVPVIAGSEQVASTFDSANPVKHIILMIGDGMNIAHEVAMSQYGYGKRFGLSFDRFPYHGVVATWDITTYNAFAQDLGEPAYNPDEIVPSVGYDRLKGGSRPVYMQDRGKKDSYFLWIPPGWSKPAATDSASSATAWATGYKTDDGNIAWLPGDPDNGALPTIAELLRAQKGFSIGVVSTVPFSHATPAAHVSHNPSRNNYHAIANEILCTVQPEVVIGGGYPLASDPPSYTYISEADYTVAFGPASDACGDLQSKYVRVQRQSGINGSQSLLTAAQEAVGQNKKLFGLFGGPDGNFESPVPQNLPGTPLVEPGNSENPTLADASLAALRVLSQDPDGFFVMIEQGDIDWANHANDYQRMVGTVADLDDAVEAVIDFINQPGDNVALDNTLVIVTADHSNSYMRFNELMGAGVLPEQAGSCSYGGPACTYPDAQISYGTTSHTNELVKLYATGHGRELFVDYEGTWYQGSRIIDNTQIFDVMAKAAGIPERSPLKLKTPE